MKPERLDTLLNRFGPRIDDTPFTEQGYLHQEEKNLILDLWASLTQQEQHEITGKIKKEKAIELDTPMEYIPDQTPYAMRLLFYYLKNKRNGVSS